MITSQIQPDTFFTSVAGCISKVECSVGGNLELRQTLHDSRCFSVRGGYDLIF
jgi:hypothetical protein